MLRRCRRLTDLHDLVLALLVLDAGVVAVGVVHGRRAGGPARPPHVVGILPGQLLLALGSSKYLGRLGVCTERCIGCMGRFGGCRRECIRCIGIV